MSTIDIDGVGYAEASAVLGDANRWAASHVATLGDALAGTGAMAGDSSFASEFAAAYDVGAVSVLSAMDDVVGALGGLCRLASCSLENHARAERSSIVSSVVVSESPSLTGGDLYASLTAPPPSCLGGDASFAPGWANVVLDHIEGFVWPDADVDRLRTAGTAWRAAASRLTDVCDLAGRAYTMLSEQRSPEIPQALQAIGGLRLDIMSVAGSCQGLGDACDEYADAVETQRQLILELVRDLVRDAVLIAAAGFVLGLVSGGGGNAVAAWVNSGKLAAEVPKFRAFIEAIRSCGARLGGALRTSADAVAQVQLRLSRFRNVEPIRVAGHTAVVDAGALARIRAIIGDPKRFDPDLLRGMSSREIRELLNHWEMVPSSKGAGVVLRDPVHFGRTIRVMRGYYKGNRPDALTHGDYVVVSQNGDRVKVPLEGNPLL